MRKTILLVEDAKNWYESITSVLKDEGYEVLLAREKRTAQEIIELNRMKIGAAIVNLNLNADNPIPDGTGYGILEFINYHCPQIPRIVLSAITKPEKVAELYERYQVSYVRIKGADFSSWELAQILHNALAIAGEADSTKPIDDKNDVLITSVDLQQHVGPLFDVFISYNNKDKLLIEKIANKLKQRGLKPWLDQEQIPGGRLFQGAIQNAILNSKSAIIFISTNGMGDWQIPEANACHARFVKEKLGFPVIPVLLPGVYDIPQDLLFFKGLQWVSFENSVDDSEAFERLVSSITGNNSIRK